MELRSSPQPLLSELRYFQIQALESAKSTGLRMMWFLVPLKQNQRVLWARDSFAGVERDRHEKWAVSLKQPGALRQVCMTLVMCPDLPKYLAKAFTTSPNDAGDALALLGCLHSNCQELVRAPLSCVRCKIAALRAPEKCVHHICSAKPCYSICLTPSFFRRKRCHSIYFTLFAVRSAAIQYYLTLFCFRRHPFLLHQNLSLLLPLLKMFLPNNQDLQLCNFHDDQSKYLLL